MPKKKKSVSKKPVSKTKKRTAKSRKKSVKLKKTVKSKKSSVKAAAGKTIRKPKPSSPVKAQRAPVPPKTYQKALNETELGEVEDYFSNLGVIALTLKGTVALGNTIHIHGHTTEFSMKVDSMQINHVPVTSAKTGDSLGIKVTGKCRKGDRVFRVD